MGFSLKKLVKGVGKIATGDIVGGIGSIAGGVIGSKGSKKAGKASAEGMQQGINYLQGNYDRTRQDFQPYTQVGTQAINRLADPAASYESSPGYQFAVDQGLDAIKTQQNSLGRLASGNTLAELTKFGVGTAQQDYNNWWNQQTGLATMGLNATGNLASFGSNNANSIASLLSGKGAAKAEGIAGATNATTDALGRVTGIAQDAFSPEALNEFDINAIKNKRIGNRLAYGG
jgi:hypothetical protein